MAGPGGALVGRERERATLASLLAAASSGRGRAAVVLGEPGIGKTALVESLSAAAAQQDVRVAWGRCTETDAPAFWPWRQALPALGASALADGSVMASRAELFAQVVDELAAGDRPAVLALEDIHWADPASLALLRFVVDALPGLPLLLVATSRDDPTEAGPSATELLRSLPAGVERLALSGLTQDEVAGLVRQVLGGQPDPVLAARIADRCGGNPFFVREVARLYASRGPAATPAVPAGVRQVLERRLARLSQPCRALLAVAAVAGEPDAELLAEVAGEPLATVLHGLGEAVTARMVLSDGHDLRFAHSLVRETLYAQQSPATTGQLHRQVAEALQRRGSGEAAAAARLAVHWRHAAGPDTRRTAAAWALVAAREARARLGFEQAVRCYDWALAAPPEDELRLRIERGEAQVLAGAFTAGRDTLREAARQALAAGRSRELARAALGTGVGGFEVPFQDDEQVALLEEARVRLTSAAGGPVSAGEPAAEPAGGPAGERAGDEALRAAVLARLSVASAARRSSEERVELAEESLVLARAAADPATQVAALAAWCDARSGPDFVEARLDRADQMIAVAARSGDPGSVLLARRLRLVALAELGDFAGVDAEIAAYARTADRLRLPLYAWPVPIWRGARALMAGDLDRSRQHLAAAEKLAGQADSVNAAMLVLVLRVWLLDFGGEREALGAATDKFLVAVGPDHPQVASLAGWYAAAGRLGDARRILGRQLAAGLATMPKDAEYLPALRLLGTAAQALADRDAAAQVYEALRPHAHRWVIDGIFAGCLGLVAHSLGRLAAMLGRGKVARGWLEQAREAHRGAGASLLLAETEGALAELSLRSGRSAMAAEAGSAAGSQLASPVAEFRRTGRVWRLHWDGPAVTVPDSKGMRDLAALLAAPDREVPVLDLVEAAGGPPAAAAGGHAGERLDRAARTAYRRRLVELDGELAEAEADADAGRVDTLRKEQQFLAAELAAAVGLSGRARTDGDPVERARKAVTMRIRTALKAIAEVNPALARHLDRSVSTGRLCAYRPERPVRWRLS